MSARITVDQEQRIIKLYQDGNTYDEISEIEKIAISTISRIIKKYDVKYKIKCGVCGKLFTPVTRSVKYCTNCKVVAQAEYQKEYRANHDYKNKNRHIAKPKAERKQKRKIKTLEEVMTIMREQHISYTDYQRMEMEM